MRWHDGGNSSNSLSLSLSREVAISSVLSIDVVKSFGTGSQDVPEEHLANWITSIQTVYFCKCVTLSLTSLMRIEHVTVNVRVKALNQVSLEIQER